MSSEEKGPVVYFTVVDATLAKMYEANNTGISKAKKRVGHYLDEYVREAVDMMLREAYVHGLRDGFAQGVAAENRATRRNLDKEKQS